MNKPHRQAKILQLIRDKRIHTQEELAAELAQVGIAATQVTLSRDMRELGLAKTPDGYTAIESAAPRAPALATVAAEFLVDTRVAQNMVVLKTLPGNANTVAIALDRESWPEVVGTIAGDDTIFVVTADSAAALRLAEKIAAEANA